MADMLPIPVDDLVLHNKITWAMEQAMGMMNWMICGGIWLACSGCALLFMRGASIVNARAAALDEAHDGTDAHQVSPGLRQTPHASRSSLPRSAH